MKQDLEERISLEKQKALERDFRGSTAPLPAGVRPGAPFMGTKIALFDTATNEQKEAAVANLDAFGYGYRQPTIAAW